MIYGKRVGSLGNQLHIIATTYATALDNQTDWSVSSITNERYKGLIERSSFNDTIFRNIPKQTQGDIGNTYIEKQFNYSPIPKKKNMTLVGYFQSNKYYEHHKTEIVKLFHEFYPIVENKVQEWFKNIDKNKTISIHIRRTDYVKLSHVHVVQPIIYYKNALSTIANKLKKTFDELLNEYNIMVFSDDLSWCKQQPFFQMPKITFIDNNLGTDLNAIVDLYTMSQCKHNIIANSSFSWWSSYMNLNKDKIIIAPKKWFADRKPEDWKDAYLEDMIVI